MLLSKELPDLDVSNKLIFAESFKWSYDKQDCLHNLENVENLKNSRNLIEKSEEKQEISAFHPKF